MRPPLSTLDKNVVQAQARAAISMLTLAASLIVFRTRFLSGGVYSMGHLHVALTPNVETHSRVFLLLYIFLSGADALGRKTEDGFF